MKSKTKIKILVALSVCMAASLVAGCKIGEQTKDEYLEANNATEWYTYFSGAEEAEFKNGKGEMDIYYPENSYFICTEATANGNFTVSREHYIFAGWYYTDVDDEGKPIKDADGNYVYNPANYIDPTDLNAKTTTGGKHTYLIAKWVADVAFDVYLVTDDKNFEVKGENGETYKSGDKVATHNFSSTGAFGLIESHSGIKATNATYLYFYADEQCTQPITSVTRPEQEEGGEEAENVKIYVKYIEGNWTVVSTARQVCAMFNNSYRNAGYYLFLPNGGTEIDCQSENAVFLKSDSFGIQIEGNGITVKNLRFTDTNVNSAFNYSILGKLSSTASIKDFTLKDVTVEARSAGDCGEMYLVSTGYEDGAQLSNFAIADISFKISLPNGKLIENIQKDGDGVYDSSNWLFGGFGSDDEFIDAVSGIKLSGASLTVKEGNNEQTVVENISKGK